MSRAHAPRNRRDPTDPEHVTNSRDSIPTKCRSCVFWLGRYSGNEHDRRCNRAWGHEARHGDFSFVDEEGYKIQTGKEVDPNCEIRRWGAPIPFIDENGNPHGEPPDPVYVPAYNQALPKEGQGLLRSTPIALQRNGELYYLNAKQLRRYLMADSPEDKLNALFESRDQRRKEAAKKLQQVYKDMYGTNLQVLQGAKELPPYSRGLERISTRIPQLDHALNGGLIPGTRVNISGQEDSGKTTLKNHLEGSILRYYLQRSPNPASEKIARIVPENYTLSYMLKAMQMTHANHGYDEMEDLFNEHVDIFDSTFQEESMEAIVSFITGDVKALGEFRNSEIWSYQLPVRYRSFSIDSIDADALAEESQDSKGNEQHIGENHRMATQARLLAEAFRKLYKASKVPVTLILLSQYRSSNFGGFGGGQKSEHRGNAHPYFVDLGLNLWNNRFDPDNDDYMRVHINFKKVHTDASVVPGEEVELALVPGLGLDPTVNSLNYLKGVDNPLVDQRGSWYYWQPGTDNEIKRQGSDPVDVRDWLLENGIDAPKYVETYMLYDRGEITEEEYDKRMYILNNPEEAEAQIADESE